MASTWRNLWPHFPGWDENVAAPEHVDPRFYVADVLLAHLLSRIPESFELVSEDGTSFPSKVFVAIVETYNTVFWSPPCPSLVGYTGGSRGCNLISSWASEAGCRQN